MKRLLFFVIGVLCSISTALASPTGSEISISCGLSTPCGATIASINVYLDNEVWLKSRNAANDADLDLLRADGSDNTELNTACRKNNSGCFVDLTFRLCGETSARTA